VHKKPLRQCSQFKTSDIRLHDLLEAQMSDQLSRREWIKATAALGAGALLPDSTSA
jgi:hypothetical protein